jgi:hypothetical protein
MVSRYHNLPRTIASIHKNAIKIEWGIKLEYNSDRKRGSNISNDNVLSIAVRVIPYTSMQKRGN